MPSTASDRPYDLLVVGSGLYGSTFAHIAAKNGKRVCVLERRSHLGGNCYTEEQHGIQIHRYGPHIFHTSNQAVWQFINQFASFNNFVNSPLAISKGELFCLPFNMHTFHQLWGVRTPEEAKAKLESQQVQPASGIPANLEEQALSLVGRDLYERLIRGYTQKQWQRDPKELPPEIIKRIPLRLTYNTNYFNDTYQGIPRGGYTQIFTKMLEGIEVKTAVDFHDDRSFWLQQAHTVVYTGQIDQLFDYDLGDLDYRTLRFEDSWHELANVQGNAVINYCDVQIPHTRLIEHKHFDPPLEDSERSVVTAEYPDDWQRGKIPYYPVNDASNMHLYERYRERALQIPGLVLGGRLAEYRYYDMHAAIGSAMLACQANGLTL